MPDSYVRCGGGNTRPVAVFTLHAMDAGGGNHSVFAGAFIDVLKANAELLTGRSLYEAVAARVAHAASRYEFEQIPAYAPIARSGHEAGDFMLLPVSL